KFVRQASQWGKNEDRSIFGNNDNNWRRWMGPNSSGNATGDHPIIYDVKAVNLTTPVTLNVNSCFGSQHTNTCYFLFCDGSVGGTSSGIDLVTLGRIANRNDGQVITAGLD